MHDYMFSADLVRFAFVLGVVVSIMLYERYHLTTGSIVVPGYIGVFLIAPMVLVATFLNAYLSYALMHYVIRRKFILYGRSKFVVMALTSIVIQTMMLKFSPHVGWLWKDSFPLFVGAGYVVPALIAHDMGRQGLKQTFRSVMLSGIIVFVPVMLALLFKLSDGHQISPLSGFGVMAIPGRWVPLAVLLSAAASWAVDQNYGLRCGGFVGAAYIGMFMGDPMQVVASYSVALVTFVIVRFGLKNWLILFGRRKFAAMLLTSSVISWTLLWTGTSLFSARIATHVDAASLGLTPLFVPGLLANDMDRSSVLRVAGGSVFGAAFVVPTTWMVQGWFEDVNHSPVWTVLAIAMLIILFGPSIDRNLRTRAAEARVAADHRPPLPVRIWAALAP